MIASVDTDDPLPGNPAKTDRFGRANRVALDDTSSNGTVRTPNATLDSLIADYLKHASSTMPLVAR